MSWQCARGQAICASLRSNANDVLVADRTGLTLDPMFSASKMRWLLDAIPNGTEHAADVEICVGTIDSWLLRSLTGSAFATDMTNASRTLLFDIETHDWSDPLLDLFGIPRVALAEVRPSAATFGACGALVRCLAGVPITALIGDSHAALVGHGAFRGGSVKASFGTGTSVLAPLDGIVRTPRLSSTVAWSRSTPNGHEVSPGIEGNIYATGAALEWTAALVGLDGDVGALESLARTVADSRGVSFIPALAGLGAPHWRPDARGTITGLTRGVGRAEVALAAFESVAHQVCDVVDEVERSLGRRPRTLNVDGGAMQSRLLARVVSDLVGVPLVRSDEPELAAVGAAHLAGLGAGLWSGIDELDALTRPVTRFEPTMNEGRRAECRDQWFASAGNADRTLTSFGTRRPDS